MLVLVSFEALTDCILDDSLNPVSCSRVDVGADHAHSAIRHEHPRVLHNLSVVCDRSKFARRLALVILIRVMANFAAISRCHLYSCLLMQFLMNAPLLVERFKSLGTLV